MESDKIIGAIEGVTKKWTRQRKAEERQTRPERSRSEYLRSYVRTRYWVDIPEEIYENAYNKMSANGTLPVHARQIWYAIKGPAEAWMSEINKYKTLKDNYFTQTLLPKFQDFHPDITRNWDVVYDARGNLTEPHDRKGINTTPMGTLGVRNYLRRRSPEVEKMYIPGLEGANVYQTVGPNNRYQAVLFTEKEGFNPLFEQVSLADKWDIAIMSTKGMPSTAARQLVENLDIPIFVLHDFDASGFTILHSWTDDTDRFKWKANPEVIDLGIRMKDIKKWGLELEPSGKNRKDLYRLQHLYHGIAGASAEEIEALANNRVELNAFQSDQLIECIETKLKEYGLEKIVPSDDTLKVAYIRSVSIIKFENIIHEAEEKIRSECDLLELPSDMREIIEEELRTDPEISWDNALYEETSERLKKES